MAECPQCHSSIQIPEQNFGTLFTCPACNAVYFVGWDGVPEKPEDKGPAAFPTHFPEAAPSENPIEQNFINQEIPAPQEIAEASVDAIVAPPAWEPGADFGAEAMAPPPAVHVDASPDFKDVVEFGNSPQLEGSLTYTVFMKGIDIADTREKLKEALTDTRFAWDVERTMGQITNGALTLPDLSPAKAVVLINRIKYLPIEVTWIQNVLS